MILIFHSRKIIIADMKVKTMICLFAFVFFVVVAGRNMTSTPLSPDDPTLHHILPPPPPSPVSPVSGDVVPKTPSLSKPPSPDVNYESKSRNNIVIYALVTLALVFGAISFVSLFHCLFYKEWRSLKSKFSLLCFFFYVNLVLSILKFSLSLYFNYIIIFSSISYQIVMHVFIFTEANFCTDIRI